ncbi:hypothetical protein [Streptomyces sp. NPDC017448]|uniref:hypothetical protein n=1 Tax=Streptomyces sp. NPDC017448 TaxID=3364996 RepID=UPI00379A65A2
MVVDAEGRCEFSDEEQAAPRATAFVRVLNLRPSVAAVPDRPSCEVIRQVEPNGEFPSRRVFDGVAYRVHRQGPSSAKEKPWAKVK